MADSKVADSAHARQPSASTTVIVPVFNGYDSFALCFEALLRNTPLDVPILIVDDASDDRRFMSLIDQTVHPSRPVTVLHRERNGGFVAACNDAFSTTGQNDVVILNSDCVVGPEWLPRLRAAAYSSTTIATATPLTNNGTILSVPRRNFPFDWRDFDMDIDEVAKRVAANSLRLRPTIPTGVGHCMFIKRRALNLLGGFDPIFGRGYGEEVDFCVRATLRGFHHVCADDVFTFHHGGSSFGAERTSLAKQGHSIITERYPWYEQAVHALARSNLSQLAFALERARIAITGPRIGIDARKLGATHTGTNRVILGSIIGLARAIEPSPLTVFTQPDLDASLKSSIEAIPTVHRLDDSAVNAEQRPLVDVIYRPCQVDHYQDLAWLHRAGSRIVINQLDLIGWRNPSYFASTEEWISTRDLNRAALKTANGVTTISEHVLHELKRENLLHESAITRVIHCGIDLESIATDAHTPPRLDRIPPSFVLSIGTNYLHKNRAFALQTFISLVDQGWGGSIVLCGPTPPHGNSDRIEADIIDGVPAIRDRIIELGSVTEDERSWLLSHASLVIYPSTSEGFGLVPFESAEHGTPVLTTRSGGLNEILPDCIPGIDDFDPEAAAHSALQLMTDNPLANAQVEALKTAGTRFRWSSVGTEIRNVIHETLDHPPNNTAAVLGEEETPILIPFGDSLNFGIDPNADRLELLISLTRRTHWIKRLISPNGSRRQQLIRSWIHAYRRNRIRARRA